MQPEIVDVIRGGGLSRVAEELEQQRMHSIRLKAEVTPEAEVELGVFWLGGLPDLPKGTQWSQWKDVPLSFIAQIRISNVAAYDVQNTLPQSGR
jgi:uncharacterized protein YwqG